MEAPKLPSDKFPYPQDPKSRPIAADIDDGDYVYVLDVNRVIWCLPDWPHLHPKILGECKPVLYAGDLTVVQGIITQLTNCSGTFQFESRIGLIQVAKTLHDLGFHLSRDAGKLFLASGEIQVVDVRAEL